MMALSLGTQINSFRGKVPIGRSIQCTAGANNEFQANKCMQISRAVKPKFYSLSNNVTMRRYASSDNMNWATYDIKNPTKKHILSCFVNGEFKEYPMGEVISDPIRKGESLYSIPKVPSVDLKLFKAEINRVPRSGLFNVYKNPEMYRKMGDVMAACARELRKDDVYDYFVKLIQLTMPKTRIQAAGEVTILRAFLENFSSDRVRFLMRGFNQAGDRTGQLSQGFRYPFGSTAVVAPFNFPLEIVAMQFLGSVLAGNYCFVKPSGNVALVFEEFLRLMLSCGLPPNCVSMFPGNGADTQDILENSTVRTVQFTGSTAVAEHLSVKLKGKVKLEDAGFDIKLLGPDTPEYGSHDYENTVDQCDQDAYAISGQKCSATSFLAVHKNWRQGADGLPMSRFAKSLQHRASSRSWENLTISPLLGQSDESCMTHMRNCLSIDGSELVFGGIVGGSTKKGKSVEAGKVRGLPSLDITVDPKYGSMSPTAVFVPLESLMKLDAKHPVFTELFGPFQIITEYDDDSTEDLTNLIDRFSHHLTLGVVSNDISFQNKILGNTIHGVTYVGNRARTTGAPQNHWFGPAGDPRAAGIGTDEAILSTWTCHREIVNDVGPVSMYKIIQS